MRHRGKALAKNSTESWGCNIFVDGLPRPNLGPTSLGPGTAFGKECVITICAESKMLAVKGYSYPRSYGPCYMLGSVVQSCHAS